MVGDFDRNQQCAGRAPGTSPACRWLTTTKAVIKERIFLDKNDSNILRNEMTMIDNSLTRPWTVMKTCKRRPKVWWAENNCVEGQGHVTIDKESYFLSGDGTILPMRKDQPPPDLKYFNQVKK